MHILRKLPLMENYSVENSSTGLLQTPQIKHSRELGTYFPIAHIWILFKHSKKKIKKISQSLKESEKVW